MTSSTLFSLLFLTYYQLIPQDEALSATRVRMDMLMTPSGRPNVSYYNTCHSQLHVLLKDKPAPTVVCFNLGYLPRGDKELTTCPETTCEALDGAVKVR